MSPEMSDINVLLNRVSWDVRIHDSTPCMINSAPSQIIGNLKNDKDGWSAIIENIETRVITSNTQTIYLLPSASTLVWHRFLLCHPRKKHQIDFLFDLMKIRMKRAYKFNNQIECDGRPLCYGILISWIEGIYQDKHV